MERRIGKGIPPHPTRALEEGRKDLQPSDLEI